MIKHPFPGGAFPYTLTNSDSISKKHSENHVRPGRQCQVREIKPDFFEKYRNKFFLSKMHSSTTTEVPHYSEHWEISYRDAALEGVNMVLKLALSITILVKLARVCAANSAMFSS